jgi:hypothetical protein
VWSFGVELCDEKLGKYDVFPEVSAIFNSRQTMMESRMEEGQSEG